MVDRGGHVWPKERGTAASDGTVLRYTVVGDDGPWVVLCSGFLCPDNWWAWYAAQLAETHRVLVGNVRGIGASHDPAAGSPEPWSIGAFAGDVHAMMDAAGARDALLVGHSMGCQVALETWRRDVGGDRVAGLGLVTGSYRGPLHDFYGTSVGHHLFPLLEHGSRLLPDRLVAAAPQVLRLPIAMGVARGIGALSSHTPYAGARGYFEHGARLDGRTVLDMAAAMRAHDAGPWLGEVDVPVLVVVAENDTFTPPHLGWELRDALPDGELHLIRDGSHGALVEFPDELVDTTLGWAARRLGHPGREPRGTPGRVVPIAVDAPRPR